MQDAEIKIVAGGGVISIGETLLPIANISYVSTDVPKIAPPYWRSYLLP